MTTLSIDVGIKNLAYCLLDEHTIYKWGVVSLIETDKKTCGVDVKGTTCTNEAKLVKNSKCYCLKHAKKEEYIIPNPEVKPSTIKKLDILKLKALADKYSIDHSPNLKKKDLVGEVLDFFTNHSFEVIENVNACDVDLITIGRSLKRTFDDIFTEECVIHRVVIENQISPIANRMKTLQGMIAQYFIMKDINIPIDFVSASNKLKGVCDNVAIDKSCRDSSESVSKPESLTYNQRKKLGVERCGQMIRHNNYTEWYQFFLNSKKKDDLSDAFLQGIWYIHHNKT